MSSRTRILFIFFILAIGFIVISANLDESSISNLKYEIEARRRKHRRNGYMMPLVMVIMLLKMIVLPMITFKTMAIVSGFSMLFSVISLAVASFAGRAEAHKHHHSGHTHHYHGDDPSYSYYDDSIGDYYKRQQHIDKRQSQELKPKELFGLLQN